MKKDQLFAQKWYSFAEIDLDTPCVVKMENNQTFLQPAPLAPDKDR